MTPRWTETKDCRSDGSGLAGVQIPGGRWIHIIGGRGGPLLPAQPDQHCGGECQGLPAMGPNPGQQNNLS